MARPKIPRKSTFIDMTAMCDVAFLLLSFFILATKTKPPEALTVQPPGSVSSKAAPDRAFLFTVTPDSRVFLTIGEDTKKKEILEFLNKEKNMQLTPQEMIKWQKAEFYALPLGAVKSYIASGQDIPAAKMPGIPVADTINNEMVDWIRSISTAYAGTNQRKLQEMLLVKGDGEAFYPVFKRIKQAFKKNDIYKFRIVTTGEAVPAGSELFKASQEKKD